MRSRWCAFVIVALGMSVLAVSVSAASADPASVRAEFIATAHLARQGDTNAQWRMGATYARLGDTAKALPWLEAAARSGHSAAAGVLGSIHEEGRGVAADRDAAIAWYRRAAESGDASAMAALARVLPAAEPSAEQWAQRAAKLGNADAHYWLGLRQLESGTPADQSEAYRRFAAAAAQGHRGAQIAAANQVLDGKRGDPRWDEALGWLRSAAEAGDPVANYLLARVLVKSETGDPAVIRKSLAAAAAGGHREAQYCLAEILAASGKQAERREAADWLGKAWSAGHVAAANLLGELMLQSVGNEQQTRQARSLFAAAADRGNHDGMYNLARMQQWGIGGERDSVAALHWYSRAAEAQHAKAIAVVDELLGVTANNKPVNTKGFWQ